MKQTGETCPPCRELGWGVVECAHFGRNALLLLDHKLMSPYNTAQPSPRFIVEIFWEDREGEAYGIEELWYGDDLNEARVAKAEGERVLIDGTTA